MDLWTFTARWWQISRKRLAAGPCFEPYPFFDIFPVNSLTTLPERWAPIFAPKEVALTLLMTSYRTTGLADFGGIEKTSLISLTSEERRTRPHMGRA